MKYKTLLLSLVGAGLCAGAFLATDDSPIPIESRESKNALEQPVYNRIRKLAAPGKTIWMMQQSHHGLALPTSDWDRLAIVVDDKTKTAEYFQFESGPLEFDPNARQKPLRVSCFLCHANGPRAIRPNYRSDLVKVSLKDRIRIALWNLGTKLNGRIEESPDELVKDRTVRKNGTPFRYRFALANQPLRVKTCLHCHSDSGPLHRGALLSQHSLAIAFMVKNKEMPPPGFSLSPAEQRELDRFLAPLPQ